MTRLRADFDPQPVLVGPRIRLDPLTADDLDALREAAADPAIWAGHPETGRYRREVWDPYAATLLASGTALTVREAQTGRVIGTTRYYATPDRPKAVAVGYTFLIRDHWGGATNREMKGLVLAHAFGTVDEVWFHIAPTNLRSQTATGRLGARFVEEKPVTLDGRAVVTQCWRLTRAVWQAGTGATDQAPAPQG